MKEVVGNRRMIQKQNLENIRSAVDKLVREVGFDGMTIRQICAEAGVSTGTFYYNFKSKDDLVADRYVRSQQHFMRLYEQEWRHMPPFEALKAYAADSIAYTNSRVLPMLTQYMKVAITETRRWRREYSLDHNTFPRTLFERAQKDGVIRDDYTPDQLAYTLKCMTMGVSYVRCMSGDEINGDDAVARLIVDWLNGLRVR